MKPAMVQYTGDFKSLIPSGWRFQKLYAKNYRAYMKDDMLIWQAGREFKIDHYGEYTSVLISHVMEHGVESLAYHDSLFGENNVRYWIILDRKNLKLIKYGSLERREYVESLHRVGSRDVSADDFFAQYREANVSENTMKTLQDFIKTGKLSLKEMKCNL
jgi:hypothetical protein